MNSLVIIQSNSPFLFFMKNWNRHYTKALPAIALLCLASLANLKAQDSTVDQGAESDIEAMFDSLGKAAEKFVTAYNGRDAAAIAALFTPQGEITGTDDVTLVGRQAIEEYYKDAFAENNAPQIALEASDVHMAAPGMAIENGMVHLTWAEAEPVRSIRYSVTHVKQTNGSWLMASSRSISEVIQPSEQIKPLHWLIGEWTLESEEGLRMDMVLHLDDRGNYLLGEALVTDAEGGSNTTTLRIGWNPATTSVYWWTFDSEGGNSCGPWARRKDDWIVKSTGITADAEATCSSQTLAHDGDTMVWIATHRTLAGEALPDLTYRFVRRAPDPLSQLPSEGAEESAPSPGQDGE